MAAAGAMVVQTELTGSVETAARVAKEAPAIAALPVPAAAPQDQMEVQEPAVTAAASGFPGSRAAVEPMVK